MAPAVAPTPLQLAVLAGCALVVAVVFGLLFVQNVAVRNAVRRVEHEAMNAQGTAAGRAAAGQGGTGVLSFSVVIEAAALGALASADVPADVPSGPAVAACGDGSTQAEPVAYADRALLPLRRTPPAVDLLSAVQSERVTHVLFGGAVCRVQDASRLPQVADALKKVRAGGGGAPVVLALGARPVPQASGCSAASTAPAAGGDASLGALLRGPPLAVLWGWGRPAS